MAMTSVAPMTIPQINRYYYVGQEPFDTIQETVTFAVSDGNFGAVIIPEGYTGSDSITAVTGGTVTVIIIDERGGQRQAYFWFNNAYTYQSIHSRGGVLTPQLNNYAFVGFGVHATIQEVIDDFATTPALTITIIVEPSYTGNEVIGELVNGDAGIIIADLRTAQWQNYTWNGTNFVPADFIPEGAIIANSITADTITSGTIDAEDATFETCIVNDSPVRTFANTADGPSQGMIWPEIGIPVSLGDHWQDPSINPASLAVWPPVGIPVSTGTAWSPSIDPATIPRTNTANTFTGLNTIGALTVTGAFTATMNNGGVAPPVVAPSAGGFALGWNTHAGVGETDFINSHGGGGGAFFWFNVGGGVIVGPTTVPSMVLDGANTLTVNGDTVSHSFHATGSSSSGTVIANSVWMDYLLPNGGRFISVGPSAGVLSGLQFAGVDSAGANYLEYGKFTVDSSFNVQFAIPGAYAAGPVTPGGVHAVGLDFFQGNYRLTSVNPTDPTMTGSFAFEGYSSDFSQSTIYLAMTDDTTNGVHINLYPTTFVCGGHFRIGMRLGTAPWTTGTPNLNSDGTSVVLNGGGTSPLFFNWDQGTGGVYFGNGAGVAGASLTNNGGLTCNAVIADGNGYWVTGAHFWGDGGSSFIDGAPNGRLLINQQPGPGSVCQVTGTFEVFGTKTFVVPHPFDDTKELRHACLEGPENGVYYRGEAITQNGKAEVTLPHYFEALTYDTERTVLLTQIFEDDDDVVIGSNDPTMLEASRVKDGKFKIRSTNPTVKVYWEVKAVRKINVDRLEVEKVKYIPQPRTKEETDIAQLIPQPVFPPANDAGVVGDRTSEAGESQPQKVRTGDAVAAGSNRARKSHKGA